MTYIYPIFRFATLTFNEVYKSFTVFYRSQAPLSTTLLFLDHISHRYIHKKATKRLFVLRTLKSVGLGTNDLVLVYCSIVRSIVEYASPVWAAIPLYLDELIESVQRKALKIIFGRADYTEVLVLAGLESLSERRVGACKRFMATARQMSPLKNIIPSPAAIESHYSIRVQLPRRQHGHTRRINDFVTYKFQ